MKHRQSKATHMHHDPDQLNFPELPDEAVAALSDLLDVFYVRFQDHYFAQLHRYYHDRPQPDRYNDQIALPLGDPPF
jgi:hypothetical protein